MSRRNLILLIIVLVVVIIAVFGFLYFRQGTTAPGVEIPGTNFISQFNPFGTSSPRPPAVAPPVDVSGLEPAPAAEASKLMKVSSMPIAGFAVFQKERLKDIPIVIPITPVPETAVAPTENTAVPTVKKAITPVKPTPPPTEFMPAVRYVEKATGNIYQTFADKIEERKFSITTIPKVYDAYFGNRGESVVMRYLKTDDRTIETFAGTLPKDLLGGDTTSTNQVKGSFLPENINDLSVSPDALKIFYLFNSGEDIVGTTLSFPDNKKVQVFDSSFTEWLSWWPKSTMITLSTKPSANIPGYMYAIDLNNKNVTKILGGINGLTTLTSPNGKLVLYGDNNLSLNVYNTNTGSSSTLGIRTLPEKCVWGNNSDVIYCAVPKLIDAGEYPDSWYQGEVTFSDQLWRIDVASRNTTLISDPALAAGGEDIDGIKLAMDDGENYLFLVNKKDSFLWKLDLK